MPQNQTPVLQDGSFPPPLGTPQDFMLSHDDVEGIPAAEAQELTAPRLIGHTSQISRDAEFRQHIQNPLVDICI